MTRYIKFEVHTIRENIGGSYPDDEWSRDSYTGSCTVVSAKIVEEDGYDILGIQESLSRGDIVYLVWAEYTSGNSFGSDGGNYELLEVLTNAGEAFKRKDFYERDNVSSYPWCGYFESLDGVSVTTLRLG